MQRVKIRNYLILFLAVAILMGCALFQTGTTAAKPMTQDQKATMMLHEWNAQFKDTMALATRTAPPLTDIEKALVVKKKAVLKQSKPLIDAYVSLTKTGGVPTQEQEDEIVALINSIGGVLWTQ